MANTSINEVVGGLGDTGKSKIGYTTTGYEQVLKALMANKLIITRQVQTTAAVTGNVNTQMQYMTYSGLTADTWNESAIEDNDGMLMLGDEPLYQGVLGTKCFGSFIIEGQLMGQQSKKRCVSDKTGLITPLTDFSLPNDLTPTNVELVGNKIGSSNPFRIGVSLDIVKFIQPFFKKFFGEGSWQQIDSLKKIIAQGKMYAQISVSTKIGNKANVIHAMVTSSHEDPASNIPDGNTVDAGGTNVTTKNIYIPYILPLLSQYNALGKVTLESGDVVGGGKVSFPFNTGNYYHLTGAIEGLTPDWIKNYCNDGTGGYNVYSGRVGSDLIGQAGEKRARVRLYLAKDAASGLPDNDQLYKGHYDVTKTKVTQMGEVVSGQLIQGKLNVLVKPGHQSNEGASGNGVREKLVNEQVANKLMAALQAKQYGCESILNKTPSGGAQYALSKKDVATCVISIHCNSGGGKGVVVLYKNKNGFNGDSTQGHPLSEPLADKIGLKLRPIMTKKKPSDSHKTHQPPHDSTGRRNDGFLRNIGTGMPAVLIELGFIDNKQDAAKLKSPQWQEKMAQAIVQGIEQWYSQYSNDNSTN